MSSDVPPIEMPQPVTTQPSPPPDPETQLRQAFAQTPEFQNQIALDRINAYCAYARGATGAGVTLGLIDGGVDTLHTKFAGKDKLIYQDYGSYRSGNCGPDPNMATCDLFHASGTAGVMAANQNPDPDSKGRHGVAFDARIRAFGVGGLSEIAETIRLLAPQVAAINISLAVPFTLDAFLCCESTASRLYGHIIDASRQTDIAVAERTIIVWEASSGGGSHGCGPAKAFCLAAPGADILFPLGGPADHDLYVRDTGTSLAAPMVTGAIAILAQQYRNELGSDEIFQCLLATADKTGVYANSDLYGQGLLDLDAATRPAGDMVTLTGATAHARRGRWTGFAAAHLG